MKCVYCQKLIFPTLEAAQVTNVCMACLPRHVAELRDLTRRYQETRKARPWELSI